MTEGQMTANDPRGEQEVPSDWRDRGKRSSAGFVGPVSGSRESPETGLACERVCLADWLANWPGAQVTR